MKKLFTILFICFALQTFAQGNLQFNQVLTYSETLNSTQLFGSVFTVPANKVWKIKSVSDYPLNYIGNNGTNNVYKGFMACINNKWTFISTLKDSFLKAGDTIKLGFYDQSSGTPIPATSANLDYFISIVEFNIVP